MTHTLSISTTAFLPNPERLLNRDSFPLFNKVRLFFIALTIRTASWAEVRQLRVRMEHCSKTDELSDGTLRIIDKAQKIRDNLYTIHNEFEKLDGLYFTKRHIRAALTEWDDLVEDLTALTDMELRALSKELAGLFGE